MYVDVDKPCFFTGRATYLFICQKLSYLKLVLG